MTVDPSPLDRLDHWLRFEEDGLISILTGKVEIGQGIHEALALVVADELDVAFERVHVAPVDTETSPDEGLTAGSRSVQETGTNLRQVAAATRQAMLTAAAARLGVALHDLTLDDGVISTAGGDRLTYADLVHDGSVLARSVDRSIVPKPVHERRLIGTSPARRDLLPKVTGAPAYVQDLDLPGMLHGRIVRPPGYGSRLRAVDVPSIQSLPGVVSVTRDGDFLGVVAEREEQAIAALRRARRVANWTEPEPLAPTSDPRYLLTSPSEQILVRERRLDEGGIPVATSIHAEYSRQHIAHGAVGPSCAVALFDEPGLTVWAHSQGIFRLRHELALVMELDESVVRVRHVEGAGCYGHNGADDVALDAALLARDVPGRPVRVQWMRDDEFAWEPYGPAMLVRLSADLDGHGRIIEWRHELWSHGHDTRPSQSGRPVDQSALLAARHLARPFRVPLPRRPRAPSSGGQRNAEPYYRFPSDRVVDHYVPDAPLRVSSLRALGAHANVFAIESFMDEIATANGHDPVEFRLRHLDDPRARAVIEAVATMAERAPSTPGHEPRGRGLGFARYKNRAAYAAVIVEVELDTEIRARRAWAAIDAGMVISRDGLLNQAEGGIIQATSWTLNEAVRTDGSQIMTRGWDTYRTLRFPEVPDVEVQLIDRPDEPPLGAGEAFAGPTSAAIANAVANACGVRLRDLPLTRDRFVAAVR